MVYQCVETKASCICEAKKKRTNVYAFVDHEIYFLNEQGTFGIVNLYNHNLKMFRTARTACCSPLLLPFLLAFSGGSLVQQAAGCDSLAVLPFATAEGLGGLYAKNADRHYTEAQPVATMPRMAHAAGAIITLDSGLQIPQVALTYAHAGSRPNWAHPYGGYSEGVNEFGVVSRRLMLHTLSFLLTRAPPPLPQTQPLLMCADVRTHARRRCAV